jgi:hypothetical protein
MLHLVIIFKARLSLRNNRDKLSLTGSNQAIRSGRSIQVYTKYEKYQPFNADEL